MFDVNYNISTRKYFQELGILLLQFLYPLAYLGSLTIKYSYESYEILGYYNLAHVIPGEFSAKFLSWCEDM